MVCGGGGVTWVSAVLVEASGTWYVCGEVTWVSAVLVEAMVNGACMFKPVAHGVCVCVDASGTCVPQGVGPTAQRAAVVAGVELPAYDLCKKHIIRSGFLGDTKETHFL